MFIFSHLLGTNLLKHAQGAGQRFSDAYFDALTRGTRYAERMPIGTLDVIRNVTGDTMREFYAKRYHPRLMAVGGCGLYFISCYLRALLAATTQFRLLPAVEIS